MRRLLFVLSFYSFLLLGSSCVNAQSETRYLKVIKGVSSQQQSVHYFHHILEEALTLGATSHSPNYEMEIVDFEFSQNRTLKLLNIPGILDVTYSVTSKQRERDYIPVKVPLLDGLFGKRRLLVAPERKQEFEALTESQLKQKVACQGRHWPDYDTLERSGYAVYGVNHFESNLRMLAKGRCDYFPRGIHEIELDYHAYNGKFGHLAKVDNIMLQYDSPVYFFVGKHHKALAQQIERGLRQMQKNGRILQMMKADTQFSYDDGFETNPQLKIFQIEGRPQNHFSG